MRISSQISRFFGCCASLPIIVAMTGFASGPAWCFEDSGLILAANRPGTGVSTSHERAESQARKERLRQEEEEDQQAEEAGPDQEAAHRRIHRKRTLAPPASSRRPGTGRLTGQESENTQQSIEVHEKAAEEYRVRNGNQPVSAPGNAQRPGSGVHANTGAKRASLREILGLKKNRAHTAETQADKPKASKTAAKSQSQKAPASQSTLQDESAAQQFDPDADEKAHMHYRKSDGSDSRDETNRSDSPPAMSKQADEPDTVQPADTSQKEEPDAAEEAKSRRIGTRRPSTGR
jgi:hypothetical protein